MRLSHIDNRWIEVMIVECQKKMKIDLIMVDKKSTPMSTLKVGCILTGEDQGQYVLFPSHSEMKVTDTKGIRWIVPAAAVISKVIPDIDEIFVPVVKVSKDFAQHEDSLWRAPGQE